LDEQIRDLEALSALDDELRSQCFKAHGLELARPVSDCHTKQLVGRRTYQDTGRDRREALPPR